jgi:hypothetical protein
VQTNTNKMCLVQLHVFPILSYKVLCSPTVDISARNSRKTCRDHFQILQLLKAKGAEDVSNTPFCQRHALNSHKYLNLHVTQQVYYVTKQDHFALVHVHFIYISKFNVIGKARGFLRHLHEFQSLTTSSVVRQDSGA